MNLRFWRLVARRRVAKPRLMITGGFLSLALIVGALIVGVLFTQPAAAASKSPKIAATNGTPIPRLEVVTNVNYEVEHEWSDDHGTTWSSLVSLGAPPQRSSFGTPAAVSDGNGRLNVFTIAGKTGENITIWQKTIVNGGQGLNWFEVPGQEENEFGAVIEIGCNILQSNDCIYYLNSDPAVTSWGPGRMDLFAYATHADGAIALIHTWADNYTWSGTWEVLGTGSMQGNPTAVSWGVGRVDVFVRGGGNELDHKWFSNSSWSSGWENLGGTLTSSPSAASPKSGFLNVYARGSNGDLWTRGWNDESWSNWIDVGCCLLGGVDSSVAAVSPGLNIVDVLELGTDHALYSGEYNLTAGWVNSQFINHAIDYTNIATTTWFLGAPPPPPTPTPTPKPSPTPVPKPPKCGTPGQPPCPLPQ